MMISSVEEILIYDRPDGSKTVYSRKMGDALRNLHRTDPAFLKEQALTARWANLKEAVLMDDPTINNAIEQVEILMRLKK